MKVGLAVSLLAILVVAGTVHFGIKEQHRQYYESLYISEPLYAVLESEVWKADSIADEAERLWQQSVSPDDTLNALYYYYQAAYFSESRVDTFNEKVLAVLHVLERDPGQDAAIHVIAFNLSMDTYFISLKERYPGNEAVRGTVDALNRAVIRAAKRYHEFETVSRTVA